MKIVGLIRAKDAGKWMAVLMEQMKVFCDEILFLGEPSSDDTNEIAARYSPVMIERPPGHEVGHGGHDKVLLHNCARDYSPDWIYAPDADELLEPGAPELIRDTIKHADSFEKTMVVSPFLYIWDDFYHYRTDGRYGTITVVRLFKYFPDMHPMDRSAHSMAVPPDLLKGGKFFNSTIRLLHFGYMTINQRQEKHDFYSHRDPPGSDGYRQGGGGGDYNDMLGANAVTDEVPNPLVIL